MSLVPFPPRSPDPARTLEQLRALKMSTAPRCEITVRKDDRDRRYRLWSDQPGYTIGEIWFGQAQHRRRRVAGVLAARMLVQQFTRELRDLLLDGWAES